MATATVPAKGPATDKQHYQGLPAQQHGSSLGSSPRIDRKNTIEIGSFKACSADQGAVDIGTVRSSRALLGFTDPP